MISSAQRVGAHLVMQGAEFSPSRAEAALNVDFGSEKNEPGDIATKGKFKGKRIPFGYARWELSWEEGAEELLPSSLAVFKDPELGRALEGLGAEQITLYLRIGYREQCNFELTPAVLKLLARLGATVAVSCYQQEDGD